MPVDTNFLEQLQQVKVSQRTVNRSIRDLISDFTSSKITIPKYQRNFVWELDKQCRFIESIFMNIPIPPIFMLETYNHDIEQVQFEVIDGVQRLTTLSNFVNGSLRLSKLEKLADLNQTNMNSLPTKISSLFWEKQLNVIIIDSTTQPEVQFEVFGRLNQGAVSLNAQELRNCMFCGEFNDFLIECSRLPQFRMLLEDFPKFQTPLPGKPDKDRMLSVEIILRLFALYEFYNHEKNTYPEPRTETLNNYMRERIKIDKTDVNEANLNNNDSLKSLLDKMCVMVSKTFKGNHFKTYTLTKDKQLKFSSTLNQAVLDIQMLGFADYSPEEISGKEEVIYEEFLKLCLYDRKFIDSISKSTSGKINERMLIWKQMLKNIFEDFTSYRHELNLKKSLFDKNPICFESGEKIEHIDEAVLFESNLYHKAYCPLLENKILSKVRANKNSPVIVSLNGEEQEFVNMTYAYISILEFIVDSIKDDEYHIQRLSSLPFIGNDQKLKAYNTKPFLNKLPLHLKNQDGENLHIDIGGNRDELIRNIQEVARLFSFLEEFAIK